MADFEQALTEVKPAFGAVTDTLEAFRSGGHYRLGDHRGLCAWVDAGPLGLGALAAHGHADALQLLLWVDGLPLLVDPGTYAYHTQRRWRDYFRGTLAHNTVRIDGLDQSVIGGNFLWMEKAQAGCTAFGRTDGAWHFSGYHDGYCRLPSPVLHRRALALDAAAACLQVSDHLQASGPHTLEQCWHFDPRWQPQLAGTQLQVRVGQARVAMALDPALDWSLVRGDDAQPLGWHSDRLDHRQPASTLVGRGCITGDTVLHTRITRLGPGD